LRSCADPENLQYDPANRRKQLALPNGIVVGYTYDSDSRVTGKIWTLGGSQINDLAYSYDADGHVVEESGNTTATAMVLPGLLVGSNTFNADNEMTSFLYGNALTYDANGNLTSDGTNTYTWDARNHLSAISGAAPGSFAYVYDALNRRVSKAVAGTTTQFVYDGLNPVKELQSGSASANLLTGLNIDEFFERTDSAGARDLLTDALGSTWGLADSSGTVQSEYGYEPFGTVAPSGATSTNPYQYTGRENDSGAGPFTGDLYYYRARYYSPVLQRFMSQDPIGFRSGDTNLYSYVFNSPLNWTDPSGQIITVIGGPIEQAEYNQATAYLSRDPGMAQIIQDLNNSSTIYSVMFNNNNFDDYSSHIISWDPHSALRCTNKGRQSPALGLGHELAHADKSLLDELTGWIHSGQYDTWEEQRVITGPEAAAAGTLGEDTRTDHKGDPYFVPGPTSR
jgi:RHS repeat-associated protein